MYSPQLLDHFQNPRNAGEITDPDASVQLENPACGDILKLTLRVTDGRIAEIRFLAKGCVPAMACGSLLTELVQGRTVKEASKLRREELVQAIGGLPEGSAYAGHRAIDALAAALKGATDCLVYGFGLTLAGRYTNQVVGDLTIYDPCCRRQNLLFRNAKMPHPSPDHPLVSRRNRPNVASGAL